MENGMHITDALAEWIKKGLVTDPFAKPPVKNSGSTR
jgi:hypothetical protein